MSFEERWVCGLCHRTAGDAEDSVLFRGEKVHATCATQQLAPVIGELTDELKYRAEVLKVSRMREDFFTALARRGYLDTDGERAQMRVPRRIQDMREVFAIIARFTAAIDPGNYTPLSRFVEEKLGATLPPLTLAEVGALVAGVEAQAAV